MFEKQSHENKAQFNILAKCKISSTLPVRSIERKSYGEGLLVSTKGSHPNPGRSGSVIITSKLTGIESNVDFSFTESI